MQLHQDKPDYAFVLRGADGQSARVNERILRDTSTGEAPWKRW